MFGGDALYLLSRASSPRGEVLRLPLADGVTVAQAECIVPATDVTIEGLAATEARLWLLDIDGGPSGLRVCDPDGGNLTRVDVPPVCAIESLGTLDAHEVVYAARVVHPPAGLVARGRRHAGRGRRRSPTRRRSTSRATRCAASSRPPRTAPGCP